MEEALERWIAAGMYYMYPAEPLPPALLEGCKVREEGREEKGRKEVRKDPTHHHPAQSLLSTSPWMLNGQKLRFTKEVFLRDPSEDANDDVSFHLRRMRQVG